MTCRLLATLLAVLLAPAAAAQGQRQIPHSVLPGLGAEDPRRPVNLAEPPWRALGRVQLEIGGNCTGALIGPRLVLTAAHCLVSPRARRLVQPGSVHFLLGYDRGAAVAHARVTAYRVGPGFQPDPPGPPARDWAVLTLDRPLGTPDRVLALLRQVPRAGAPLMLGGYQQDRREVLLADTGCQAIGLARLGAGQPMLAHDCAGTRGASGGPLLAQGPDGRWAILGVAASGVAEQATGFAVPAALIEVPEG